MQQLIGDPGTRPDFAPMDMGSVNADLFDDRAPSFRQPGSVYLNKTDVLLGLATKMRHAQIKPSLVAWNVSFVRLIGAFADMSLLDVPLFVSLVLTDKILISGHPGTAEGLDAYLAFLPRNHPVAWAVTYIGGSMDRLLDKIILAGGHIQVGLGDYHYGENGSPTNAHVIANVVRRATSSWATRRFRIGCAAYIAAATVRDDRVTWLQGHQRGTVPAPAEASGAPPQSRRTPSPRRAPARSISSRAMRASRNP